MNLGRYQDALDCIDLVLEKLPRDPRMVMNRATILDRMDRHAEAVPCYERILELDPDTAIKAHALNGAGRHEEALACLARAGAAGDGAVPGGGMVPDPAAGECPNPEDIDAADRLCREGLALKNAGRPKEALEMYDRALEILPGHSSLLGNKAVALRHLGMYKEALSWVGRAIEANPSDPAMWINKANFLSDLGRCEEALECVDRALDLDPGRGHVLLRRAHLLSTLDRVAEALDCCDRVLEADPGNTRALDLRDMIKSD